VQGDLADLGEPVTDRTLVLNVLCGLNEKFASIGRHLRRGRPFPSFLEVCDDLILEEITMAEKASTPSSALLAGTSSTPSASVQPWLWTWQGDRGGWWVWRPLFIR